MIPALLDVLTIFFFVVGLLLLWLNLREWRRRKARLIFEADPVRQEDVRSEAKSLDLPAEVTRDFVNAMNDYFAEDDQHIREAIAAEQLDVLKHYRGPRDEPLRLSDVKSMFEQLRNVT